ncbi:UNVERIFIED_CONTAM: AAA domain-containing protein [Acetivibrio alkalicellulosi]
MLKRINEIINVGNFYSFKNGSRFQFDKLTLIYGLNTYGKSTIVDIFNSLASNAPSRVMDRTSIGGTGKPVVSFSFYSENNKTEQKVTFSNSAWSGYNNSYDIQIFDNKYISDNVLTGLDVTRDNKLNMTEFILGEENVKLATDISEMKKSPVK